MRDAKKEKQNVSIVGPRESINQWPRFTASDQKYAKHVGLRRILRLQVRVLRTWSPSSKDQDDIGLTRLW
uniref:Uncharacterized protein n=1 Tax=Tanacetum cinerariifolium TaxID=118510 RepID=A0A6L2M7T8_TANCI|nr:hypothetical protein [Tanacetum cinerariifolium]